MHTHRHLRLILFTATLLAGAWVVFNLSPKTGSETGLFPQALAPGRLGSANQAADDAPFNYSIEEGEPVLPAIVDIQTIPSGPAEVDHLKEAIESGQQWMELNEGPVNAAIFNVLMNESMNQAVDLSVQNYNPAADNASLPVAAFIPGASFKAIDYTQSQQGVPPDPDIMVGKDHIVVGVNTSFQVFDKSGTSLVGPLLYETFWGSNCGTGSGVVMFDPYSAYDEENGRYVLGITAYDPAVNGGDNGWACIAVSQTDSAAGLWHLYSFDGNPGGGSDYFFDYPHIGVGQDALYLSANMFGVSFVRNHVFAFEKDAMYAGTAASSVKINISSNNFTLQPAKLKGFLLNGWPTNPNEPHYFVDAQYGNGQNTLTVWAFSDPWGSPSLTSAGTVIVNSYSLPISQPQLGGSNIQGNDNRLLDVEYWGGRLWSTHTVGCNPGGGTVNCVRWYEIDISSGTPSLVQQGTFASSGEWRSFPDLGVNACGDMLVGYTKTSTSLYPGVYVAGREATDPAGTLKDETLVHAGEDFYTAYDSVPRRWGDYTGMALDPDGLTFWYLGEYSRNQPTARWSTWVGGFTYPSCTILEDFAIQATPESAAVCNTTDSALFDVDVPTAGGFSDPVVLSATGMPSGATANFSANPVPPPGSSVLTIGSLIGAAPGPYTVTVQGEVVTTTLIHTDTVALTVYDAAPGAATIPAPSDGQSGVPLGTGLAWSAVVNATSYDVEVATDAAFSNIVAAASGLTSPSYMPPALLPNTIYYWRVTTVNACGSVTSPIWSFLTEPQSLVTACSTPGLAIPDGNPTGVFDDLVVASGGAILDLDVTIDISHTWVGDLSVTLTKPGTPTTVSLIDRPGVPASTYGCSANNIDVIVNDEGPDSAIEGQCSLTPPAISGDAPGSGLLSGADGETLAGTWRLTISDVVTPDSGTLNEWCLVATLAASAPPADFSDLVSSYGVAWHEGDGAVRLGSAWTAGLSYTNGVDNADDDGVVADISTWVPGQPASIDVTVTGPDGIVYLAGWFDWNGDGDFADAGEQLIGQPVIAAPGGQLNVVGFIVDAGYNATLLPNLNARFRLYEVEPVAAPGAAETSSGGAVGGEVEDYTLVADPTAIRLSGFDAAARTATWPMGLLLVGLVGILGVWWLKREQVSITGCK